MKLNKEHLKGMLKISLEKYGSSLEEFEKDLPIIKQSDAGWMDYIKNLGGGAKGLGMLYAGLMAAEGATAGIGAYKSYDAMKNTDSMVTDKMNQEKKIRDANMQLQHLLQHPIQ